MRDCIAFVVAMAGAGLIALGAGCDSKKDSPERPAPAADRSGGARPSGRDLLAGGAGSGAQATAPSTPGATPGATPAPSAGNDAARAASVPFNDATADAAVETYMKRLAAGDIAGAVEVCAPDAPGTETLRKQAAGLSAASKDMGNIDLAGLLVEHIREMTWQKESEEGDRAVFVLTGPTADKQQRLEVVKQGSGWRVVPPATATGMP